MSNQSSVEDESESSRMAKSDEESTCSGLKDDLILYGDDLERDRYNNGILPGLALLSQLRAFINAWSSNPSADRGRPHRLRMKELYITRPFITRLLPLLLHQEGSTSALKFHSVEIESCRFCSQATFFWGLDQDEDVCTPQDKNSFLSALARFPGSLSIDDSYDRNERRVRGPPEILSGLLRLGEIDSFKVTELRITDYWQQFLLSDLEYIKLGAMIQGNEQLTDLVLWLRFPQQGIPREFLDHLANSVHLRSLSLDFYACPWGDEDADNLNANNLNAGDQDSHVRNLPDFFNADFRDSDFRGAVDQDDDDFDEDDQDEDDHDDDDQDADDQDVHDQRRWDEAIRFGEEIFGIVERLLRNPRSQLIRLDLQYEIEDHHLTTLAQLLPTSNIRTLRLNLYACREETHLEFARQFQNMLSLNSIYLEVGKDLREPDINEDIKECGDFFLQGLIKNPSITRFNMYHYFPQRPLMLHYLSLNRAGRKLLLSSSQESPIPDGLWPLVLERAGASGNRHGPHFIRDCDDDNLSAYMDHGPVNAMFFFVQNCRKLLSYAAGTGG